MSVPFYWGVLQDLCPGPTVLLSTHETSFLMVGPCCSSYLRVEIVYEGRETVSFPHTPSLVHKESGNTKGTQVLRSGTELNSINDSEDLGTIPITSVSDIRIRFEFEQGS